MDSFCFIFPDSENFDVVIQLDRKIIEIKIKFIFFMLIKNDKVVIMSAFSCA